MGSPIIHNDSTEKYRMCQCHNNSQLEYGLLHSRGTFEYWLHKADP